MKDHKHNHDLGFAYDLPKLIGRRRALALLGGAAAVTATPGLAASCVVNSSETQGPYPADGTVGWLRPHNVLKEAGVLREDIKSSFAGLTPQAEGTPMTLELTLLDANNGCAPLPGRALYLWHCDAVGNYSLYDDEDRNYLRGVGISDENGIIRFTTIFPGCYVSRWPHFHFEVFENVDQATSGKDAVLTSQIALPKEVCDDVYANDANYTNGTRNLSRLSLEQDMVFADNSADQQKQQMMTVEGTRAAGLNGRVSIGLA